MSSVRDSVERSLIGFEQGINVKTVEQLRSQTRARFAPMSNPKISVSEKHNQKASVTVQVQVLPTDPGDGNYTLELQSYNGKTLKIRAIDTLKASGNLHVSGSAWASGEFSLTDYYGSTAKFSIDVNSISPAVADPPTTTTGGVVDAQDIVVDKIYTIKTTGSTDYVQLFAAVDNNIGTIFKAFTAGTAESGTGTVEEHGGVASYNYKVGAQALVGTESNKRLNLAVRVKEAIELANRNGHINIIPALSDYDIKLTQSLDGLNGNRDIALTTTSAADNNVLQCIGKDHITGGTKGFLRTRNGQVYTKSIITFNAIPTGTSITFTSLDGTTHTVALADAGGGTASQFAAAQELKATLTHEDAPLKNKITVTGDEDVLTITQPQGGRVGQTFITSGLLGVAITDPLLRIEPHPTDPDAFALGLTDALDPIFQKEQFEEWNKQRLKRVTFDLCQIINAGIATYGLSCRIIGDDNLMITQDTLGEAGMKFGESVTVPIMKQTGLNYGLTEDKFSLKNFKLLSKDLTENYFKDVPTISKVCETPTRTLECFISGSLVSSNLQTINNADPNEVQVEFLSAKFTTIMNETFLSSKYFNETDEQLSDSEPVDDSDAAFLTFYYKKFRTNHNYAIENDGKNIRVFINTRQRGVRASTQSMATTFYSRLSFALENVASRFFPIQMTLDETSIPRKIVIKEKSRLTSFSISINNITGSFFEKDFSNSVDDSDNPINKVNIHFRDESEVYYYLKPNHDLNVRSFGFGKATNNSNFFDDISLHGAKKLQTDKATGKLTAEDNFAALSNTVSFVLNDGTNAVTFTADDTLEVPLRTTATSYKFGTKMTTEQSEIELFPKNLAMRIFDAVTIAKANSELNITPSSPWPDNDFVILVQDTSGNAGNTNISVNNAVGLITPEHFSGGSDQPDTVNYSSSLTLDPLLYITDTGAVRFPIQQNNYGLILGFEYDGIIEPIEIRSNAVDRMVTEVPLYGIKGSMGGEYNHSEFQRSAETITNDISYEKTKIVPFLDNVPTIGAEMGFSEVAPGVRQSLVDVVYAKIPGVILKNDRAIYPFIDTEERIFQALPLEGNNPDNVENDRLVAEIFELDHVDDRNLGAENFRRRAGFDFSTSPHPGTDSIVFGGLTYV